MDRIIAPGKFLIQDLTPKKLAFLKKGDLSLNLIIFGATGSRSLGGVKRGRVFPISFFENIAIFDKEILSREMMGGRIL